MKKFQTIPPPSDADKSFDKIRELAREEPVLVTVDSEPDIVVLSFKKFVELQPDFGK